jgi:CO dehydrogenase maturation factor
MTMSNQGNGPLAGMKIGIFGKGGCGKSTLTVLLAKALRRRGYEVAILDADSTNVGLPPALGLERSPRPLIDYLGGMVFSGGLVTCPVDDPTTLTGAKLSLARIPEEFVGRSEEGIHLLVAGKLGERGAGAGCDGPISKIARDLRLHGDGEDPVTLVDFKAGLEDTARGVIVGLDLPLAVVDPTLAAVQMAVDLRRTIELVRAGALPATQHLGDAALVELAYGLYRNARVRGLRCVLSKIPNGDTERFLRSKLRESGIDPIGAVHIDETITVSWLKGVFLDGKGALRDVEGILEKLETLTTDDQSAKAGASTSV